MNNGQTLDDGLDQIDMCEADSRAGNYQRLKKSDVGYSKMAAALDGAFTIVSDAIFSSD